jgi:hypothetical protein
MDLKFVPITAFKCGVHKFLVDSRFAHGSVVQILWFIKRVVLFVFFPYTWSSCIFILLRSLYYILLYHIIWHSILLGVS